MSEHEGLPLRRLARRGGSGSEEDDSGAWLGNPSAARGLRQEATNYSEGAPHNAPPEDSLVAIIWARIQSSRYNWLTKQCQL